MGSRRTKPRNKKGTVAIECRSGMLSLRWRYLGKRYFLALGMPENPLNRRLAQGKASEIQADMAYGRFDVTLQQYRSQEDAIASPAMTTAHLFEQYTEHRSQEGTSGQAIASRYRPLLSNLKRFGKSIEDTETARAMVEMLRSRQSPRIANQNLGLLKAFGKWCVEQDFSPENPYSFIKPLKDSRNIQNRQPFTQDEVKRFLATLQSDPTYCYYYDFCLTLFSLGLRPSEAIGLRWQHVDLARKQVTIAETLARSEDGKTAGYARQRKATKTANVRSLPLNERLVAMFQARCSSPCQPDDLVFTTSKGRPIDDHNFRERVWKRVCTAANIPYRPPYTARHTLLSHGIEFEGWTLPQAAQIAGHANTRMVAQTYGHMINQPRLPEF